MSANDLATRGDQRRKPHVLSDARDFLEHLLHLVERILLNELGRQIRKHATGNLGTENFSVHTCEVALKLVVFLPNLSEMVRERPEALQVQARIVLGIRQGGDHSLGRRMGGPSCQRGDGRVQHVQPAEDRHQS